MKILNLMNYKFKFASLDELINDICEEFDADTTGELSVGIIITAEDVPKYLKALLSKDRFTPVWLEYNSVDYKEEYHILLKANGEIWLVSTYDYDKESYYNALTTFDTVTLLSKKASKEIGNRIILEDADIVFFDIEK